METSPNQGLLGELAQPGGRDFHPTPAPSLSVSPITNPKNIVNQTGGMGCKGGESYTQGGETETLVKAHFQDTGPPKD